MERNAHGVNVKPCLWTPYRPGRDAVADERPPPETLVARSVGVGITVTAARGGASSWGGDDLNLEPGRQVNGQDAAA